MRIIFYLILIHTAMSIIINTIYYHVSIGMVNSFRSFYESKVGSRNMLDKKDCDKRRFRPPPLSE